MELLEETFAAYFEHWGIRLPKEDLQGRKPGNIVQAGWSICYLFGADAEGEYLDFYASHGMTNDRHERIRANGDVTSLPAVCSIRRVSKDIAEDARLERELTVKNRRVERMLAKKGFWHADSG